MLEKKNSSCSIFLYLSIWDRAATPDSFELRFLTFMQIPYDTVRWRIQMIGFNERPTSVLAQVSVSTLSMLLFLHALFGSKMEKL